jgi:hypothetical protein
MTLVCMVCLPSKRMVSLMATKRMLRFTKVSTMYTTYRKGARIPPPAGLLRQRAS